MAFSALPSASHAQVLNYSPDQTVGQFAQGVQEGTDIATKPQVANLDLQTKLIAFQKLKALAPYALEQAKQDLLANTMQDTEYQGGSSQADRESARQERMYGRGVYQEDLGPYDSGINESVARATKSEEIAAADHNGDLPAEAFDKRIAGMAKVEQPNVGMYDPTDPESMPVKNPANVAAQQIEQAVIPPPSVAAQPADINAAIAQSASAGRRPIRLPGGYAQDPTFSARQSAAVKRSDLNDKIMLERERAKRGDDVWVTDENGDLKRVAAGEQAPKGSKLAGKGGGDSGSNQDLYINPKTGAYTYVKKGAKPPDGLRLAKDFEKDKLMDGKALTSATKLIKILGEKEKSGTMTEEDQVMLSAATSSVKNLGIKNKIFSQEEFDVAEAQAEAAKEANDAKALKKAEDKKNTWMRKLYDVTFGNIGDEEGAPSSEKPTTPENDLRKELESSPNFYPKGKTAPMGQVWAYNPKTKQYGHVSKNDVENQKKAGIVVFD